MPIDISKQTTFTRIEFMRACTALADYTSQGMNYLTTREQPYAHQAWREENAAAWTAFHALPKRDQRGWAEALFAASLGIDMLGEVKKRQSRLRLHKPLTIPTHLMRAIARMAVDTEEFLYCIDTAYWTPTTAPAEPAEFCIFRTEGRDRTLEFQVFISGTQISKIWDVGAQKYLE